MAWPRFRGARASSWRRWSGRCLTRSRRSAGAFTPWRETGPRAATGAREAAVYVANLRRAADRLAEEGVTLVIEPINTRDMPAYFLNTTGEAMSVIEEAGRDNLKLQLDLYHCQIMEGDLAAHVRRLAGRYAHVQIAGVPERHEPDRGEVNYDYLLSLLDEIGYDGWVGCEYRPAGDTRAGLGWARRWGCHGASHDDGSSSGTPKAAHTTAL